MTKNFYSQITGFTKENYYINIPLDTKYNITNEYFCIVDSE